MLPDVPRTVHVAAFWIPLVLCTAIALIPNPTGPVTIFSGAVAHAAAFAYLAVALFLAHFRDGPALDVALWLFAFGVLIEVVQIFVEGRSGEFLDLAIDAVGIVLGCAIYGIWTRFKITLA